MRRPALDIGTVGRVVGFVAVAATIVATAVHFHHEQIGTSDRVDSAAASVQSNPLARELARCQAIGMAAKDDAACEAAWAENRRRFFTYRQPTEASPAVARPSTTPTADR
jgi:conjugative transfer region protein TrbK